MNVAPETPHESWRSVQPEQAVQPARDTDVHEPSRTHRVMIVAETAIDRSAAPEAERPGHIGVLAA